MKKTFVAIVMFLLLLLPAFSQVKAEAIFYSDRSALENMCLSRGVDTTGSDDELRDRLYAYEKIEKVSLNDKLPEDGEVEGEKNKYHLVVMNADDLEQQDGVVTLSGSVSIQFSTENSSSPKSLSASKIIVDSNLSKVTALGNALFMDSDSDASLQQINADIFTIDWDEESFFISGGTTSSERKNIDDKAISFYTTGDTLSYRDEGSILFEEGFITSNPKHAYSSISAKKLAILPGEDMFLVGAFFNIGRVPVFYLPAFVFPGSKIVGNPNFGFSSTRGAFVNTTFEVFGSYTKFKEQDNSSSFTAILKSADENGDQLPYGYYYSSKEPSKLDKWAKDTSSYMVLKADAYAGNGQNSYILPQGGVHVGVDSNLSLLSKKLNLTLMDGFAVSSPVLSDGSEIRYYGVNTMKFDGHGLSIDSSYPFYSDSLVLRDFGNRLSGFSIEPLLGNESVFPQDYASEISSFKRFASFNYSMPSKFLGQFVSSFSISDLTYSSQYQTNTVHRTSYGASDYYMSSQTMPSFSGKLAGTFYDVTWNKKEEKSSDEQSENSEGKGSKEESKVLHEENTLLKPLYTQNTKQTTTKKTNKILSSSLKYSLSESGSNVQDYDNKGKTSETMNSTTSGKVSFDMGILDQLNLSNNLTPTITISNSEKISTSNTTLTKAQKVSLTDDFKLSLNKLGLTYSLSTKLYNANNQTEEKQVSGTTTTTETSTESVFKWEKDYISTHQIVFSKSYSSDFGKLSGSLTYVLPPLEVILKPSLSWSKGKFTASMNWKFIEKERFVFDADVLNVSAEYKGNYLTVAETIKYDASKFDMSDLWKPLENVSSIKLGKGNYYFSNQVKYQHLSPDGSYRRYFASINNSLKLDFLTISTVHKSLGKDDVRFSNLNVDTNLQAKSVQFWKGRIFLSFALNSSLRFDNIEKDKSYFEIKPKVTASVAEFMDVTFSFSTQNKDISSYFDDDKLSWKLLLDDLKRSLDFFGNGRKNTSFIMNNVSLEFVHYMEDWNLNCKYSTELVKSGKVYTLQPSLSVYLSWKTMPDLKAEENWKQVILNDGSTEWQQY